MLPKHTRVLLLISGCGLLLCVAVFAALTPLYGARIAANAIVLPFPVLVLVSAIALLFVGVDLWQAKATPRFATVVLVLFGSLPSIVGLVLALAVLRT